MSWVFLQELAVLLSHLVRDSEVDTRKFPAGFGSSDKDVSLGWCCILLHSSSLCESARKGRSLEHNSWRLSRRSSRGTEA